MSYTEDGQTGARGIGISVRGIGTLVSGENAFINTIGVYLDEFSVVSVPNQVANPELPDMERVEILRGPQGTYFGLIGLELPKAPEISASLAGEYRWPIVENRVFDTERIAVTVFHAARGDDEFCSGIVQKWSIFERSPAVSHPCAVFFCQDHKYQIVALAALRLALVHKCNFDTCWQNQLGVRSATKGAHAAGEMTGAADAGA